MSFPTKFLFLLYAGLLLWHVAGQCLQMNGQSLHSFLSVCRSFTQLLGVSFEFRISVVFFLIIYFLSSSQISPWKEASSKHPPTPTHGGITVSIFNRYFKHNAFLCNFFFYKYNDLQRIFKANFYNINDSRTVIVSHVILSRNTSFCLITSLTVFCFMHDICHSHWI